MSLATYFELYDLVYSERPFRAEAETILAIITKLLGSPPRRMLDIGCGTGVHDMLFAERGIALTGIDASQEAIAVARKKLAPGAVSPEFREGLDVSEPDGTYDAVVSLAFVVNYVLNRSTLRSYFRTLARNVRPGGAVVFDAWNGIAPQRKPPFVKRTDDVLQGARVVVETYPGFDAMAQTVDLDTRISVTWPDGTAQSCHHTYRIHLWTPRDLIDAAEEAGLEVVEVSKWMEPGTKAEPDDWRITFQAQKRPLDRA